MPNRFSNFGFHSPSATTCAQLIKNKNKNSNGICRIFWQRSSKHTDATFTGFKSVCVWVSVLVRGCAVVCVGGCGIFVAAQKTNQANALGKCCHTRQTHAGTHRLRHTHSVAHTRALIELRMCVCHCGMHNACLFSLLLWWHVGGIVTRCARCTLSQTGPQRQTCNCLSMQLLAFFT